MKFTMKTRDGDDTYPSQKPLGSCKGPIEIRKDVKEPGVIRYLTSESSSFKAHLKENAVRPEHSSVFA